MIIELPTARTMPAPTAGYASVVGGAPSMCPSARGLADAGAAGGWFVVDYPTAQPADANAA